ncbi:hypothetical protein MC885_009129 [Smutsia gigantea]|nr:hypothetical protein MC885_009129 [Smutsia gigantea]
MLVKPTNDNEEFEKQKIAAIAEVAKSKETKTFGGGGGGARSNLNMSATGNQNREILQKEKSAKSDGKHEGVYRELVDEKALKHITEMGSSKEASRQALMDNGNNLEAALNKPVTGPPLRGKGKGRGRLRSEDEEGLGNARLSAPSTLFDFLDSKMGTLSVEEPKSQLQRLHQGQHRLSNTEQNGVKDNKQGIFLEMIPDSQEMKNLLVFKETLKIQSVLEGSRLPRNRGSERPSTSSGSEVWAEERINTMMVLLKKGITLCKADQEKVHPKERQKKIHFLKNLSIDYNNQKHGKRENQTANPDPFDDRKLRTINNEAL